MKKWKTGGKDSKVAIDKSQALNILGRIVELLNEN